MVTAVRIPLLWVVLLTLAGCGGKSEPPGPVHAFPMRGVIVRLEAKHRLAFIKHEKIEGFMEAMTMEFPVKQQAEFDMLKPGMKITAVVKQRQSDMEYWIEDIRVIP